MGGRLKRQRRFLVYGLVEAATGTVFYVGRSSMGMGRAWRHLREGRERSKDDATHRHVRALQRDGERVEPVVLEEVEPGPDVDARLMLAESRWMLELRAKGHPLLNSTHFGGLGGNGRQLSQGHREKIRLALRGRHWSKDNPNHFVGALPLKRPVYCHELDLVFLSQEDAANHLGLHPQNVGKVANGLRHTAGGYTFEPVSIVRLDFPMKKRARRGRNNKQRSKRR